MKKYPIILFLVLFCLMRINAESPSRLPIVTIMPFSGSNISSEELKAFEEHIFTTIYNSQDYRIIAASERDLILEETGIENKLITDDNYVVEFGKAVSADLIVTGSLGYVAERYILTLKIVDIKNGETLKVKTDRYTSKEVLVEKSREFIKSFFDVNKGNTQNKNEVHGISTDLEFEHLIKRVNKSAYYRWIQRQEIPVEDYNGVPNADLMVLNAYISETLPKGLNFQFGFLGGGLKGLVGGYFYTEQDDYKVVTEASGFNGGASVGFLYRFQSNLGFGVWIDLYNCWYDQKESFYYLNEQPAPILANGSSVYEGADTEFAVSFIPFLDIPIAFDSFGIILGVGTGIGKALFNNYSINIVKIIPCVGLRIKNINIRYSYGLSFGGYLEHLLDFGMVSNHQVAIIYTSSIGSKE